jgi:uncharacterized protein
MSQDSYRVVVCAVVKTPGLSPVKTRLAKVTGQHNAELFYTASLNSIKSFFATIKFNQKTLEENTQSFFKFETMFAVAEKEALNHVFWEGENTILQVEGGLGQRLNHIYKTLIAKFDSVLLIGGDLPHLNTNEILKAVNTLQLKQSSFVVGPTLDGGYYLFGGSIPLPKEAFTNIEYSVATTCEAFSDELTKHGKVTKLAINWDVDEWEDLQKLEKMFYSGMLPQHCEPIKAYFCQKS